MAVRGTGLGGRAGFQELGLVDLGSLVEVI